MEYSCLKTITGKHKSSVRKIIRKYKDKKTWSVPYETKEGTKRVRPVKIADCKRGEASDIVFQRTKFNWKSTIRQRLKETCLYKLYNTNLHEIIQEQKERKKQTTD